MIVVTRVNSGTTCAACGKPAAGFRPVWKIKAQSGRQEPQEICLCTECSRTMRRRVKYECR